MTESFPSPAAEGGDPALRSNFPLRSVHSPRPDASARAAYREGKPFPEPGQGRASRYTAGRERGGAVRDRPAGIFGKGTPAPQRPTAARERAFPDSPGAAPPSPRRAAGRYSGVGNWGRARTGRDTRGRESPRHGRDGHHASRQWGPPVPHASPPLHQGPTALPQFRTALPQCERALPQLATVRGCFRSAAGCLRGAPGHSRTPRPLRATARGDSRMPRGLFTAALPLVATTRGLPPAPRARFAAALPQRTGRRPVPALRPELRAGRRAQPPVQGQGAGQPARRPGAGLPQGRAEGQREGCAVRVPAPQHGRAAERQAASPRPPPNNELGDTVVQNDKQFLASFPYLAPPQDGVTVAY